MRVVVVGGCGHVGLPLAVVLADHGHQVVSFDIDSDVVKRVNAGEAPFLEPGLDDLLARTRAAGGFEATDDPASIAAAEVVIVVIGTPVDDHLNPDPSTVVNALAQCAPHMADGQLVVLRSTIYPGVTSRVEQMLRDRGLGCQVVFCPERIAEGFAIRELTTLPQIVGGREPEAIERAEELFRSIGISTVVVTPEEAELAKLFTNTWRYIKFAAANQFWLMANEAGVDYTRVRHAITFEYPRAADVPGAGFAAGPCLFKDTMQLAAFTNNNFVLGHSAMLVNEGLPLYVVDRVAQRFDIGSMTVGILGMAFKSESDDTRSSLSYKLRRILRFRAREVLTTDPYVATDTTLSPLEEVVARADLLIIGAPHRAYADLACDVPVIDIWNLRGEGSLI
jgi:UDP-N-acetyl-D-mannosaminuronic acid dehydrogenase